MPSLSDTVVQKLSDVKVFTIDVLTGLLHCSLRTTRRRLHELGAFTSFNHNAKYHTLPDIPHFDDFGIWWYNDIGFSRHGNLTRTVRHLVDHSPEGLTAKQLCDILCVPAASLSTFFRGIPGIIPHRVGRTTNYFSAQPEVKTLQVVRYNECAAPLSSADAVTVLVDLIKHPSDSIEHCVRRLRYRSAAITPQSVRLLLARHGIEKKTAEQH